MKEKKEVKTITIPFDVELAKKIQNVEYPGKIVTRNGKNVRVVCWDAKCDYPIIALVKYNAEQEQPESYKNDGSRYNDGDISDLDLLLQVPKYTQYKKGDIICSEKNGRSLIVLVCSVKVWYITCYAMLENNELVFNSICTDTDLRIATEREKEEFINALKSSSNQFAKEYLNQFFKIEKEQKYQFKPFEKVVVRFGDNEIWKCDLYSHYEDGYNYPFACVGGGYGHCVPYNEQTKHLIGTTDNWDE